MQDITPSPNQTLSSPLIKWIPSIFYRPRRIFENLTNSKRRYWLAPMLVLMVTILGNVLVSGWLKQQIATMGQDSLPADFQYYSPEQQTQYMQAMQVTQGPVFVYILPALAALSGLWLSWLAIGGLLYLTTTLFGGRGDMLISLNVTAWAGLPMALRDIIRIVAMLVSKQLISHPGLSGFAYTPDSNSSIFWGQVLSQIDIYLIWVVFLIVLGLRLTSNISLGKAISCVAISVLSVFLIRALIGLAVAKFGGLNVVRPFFF